MGPYIRCTIMGRKAHYYWANTAAAQQYSLVQCSVRRVICEANNLLVGN